MIGFHCPNDWLTMGRLSAVLASAPAEVEWDAPSNLVTCRRPEAVLCLALEPANWINLWVESCSGHAGAALLADVEEALVCTCAAASVAPGFPDRLVWVVPFLAPTSPPAIRTVARLVVGLSCQTVASVAAQDFEVAARCREAPFAAAANLARLTQANGGA